MRAAATGFNFKFSLQFAAGTTIPIGAVVRIGRIVVLIGAPFSTSAAAIPVLTAAPAVGGTAQVGLTLTTTNGTWTNSPTGFSYQWLAGDVNILGATNSTYVPVSGNVGQTISCLVFALNAGGTGSAQSVETAAVIS